MGYWKNLKKATIAFLDNLEGKEPKPTHNYQLNPDMAPYLGTRYYHKDDHLPPTIAGSSSTLPIPKSMFAPAAQSKPRQVAIGEKVPTPLRLDDERWVVMRSEVLLNDDKLDEAVGREQVIFWAARRGLEVAVKANSALIAEKAREELKKFNDRLRERAKEEVAKKYATQLGRKAQDSVDVDGIANTEGDTKAKDINPLRSPSVEDFFAAPWPTSDYSFVDTLPENPLVGDPRFAGPSPYKMGKVYVNPLDTIPRTEMVMLFRRDTKELFVRLCNGELYSVVYKVLLVRPKPRGRTDDQDGTTEPDYKITKVQGMMEGDAHDQWLKIDWQ